MRKFPVLACISLMAAGCSSNNDKASDFEPSIIQVDCTAILPTEITDGFASVPVECGQLKVPADWAKPKGPTMDIAYYKIPSKSATPAVDPVVYLAGGPGSSASDAITELAVETQNYLLDYSDVYVVDQRGTGASIPAMYCPEQLYIANDPRDEKALKACAIRLAEQGVDFSNFTSANNAYDFDALRRALGIDQWNLYGVSYGTRVALNAMRDSAKGIRSVVLDSVFPPQVNGSSDIPTVRYGVIDQVAATCLTSSQCNAAIPDMKKLIEDGVARLENNPVEFVTGSVYLTALLESVFDPNLPKLVKTVAEGSDEDIQTLIANGTFSPLDPTPATAASADEVDLKTLPWSGNNADAMAYSILCAEEYPYLEYMAFADISKAYRNTTQSAILGLIPAAFDPEFCKYFPVPAAPRREIEAVTSDIPTMILASNMDIQTPSSWSMLAGETLKNSQYLEFDGFTHVLLGQGETSCLKDLTLKFLSTPDEKLDTSCIADEPTFEYIISEQ